jgi:hypothetical protein
MGMPSELARAADAGGRPALRKPERQQAARLLGVTGPLEYRAPFGNNVLSHHI